MAEMFYKQVCPFCGKEHFRHLHINIICDCGAKYYFNTTDWLNRETGEKIHRGSFEVFTVGGG